MPNRPRFTYLLLTYLLKENIIYTGPYSHVNEHFVNATACSRTVIHRMIES